MDTEGPISVLDRRPRSTGRERIIADRITRQRSPGATSRHQHDCRTSNKTGGHTSEDDCEELVYRISQPYRTSFSAKHSVTWAKPDRSRSLSPTCSVRSDLSYSSVPTVLSSSRDKHRTRKHSQGQKRVTYNTRVTVRHSDTEDSVVTELSSHEDDDIRPTISPFSRSLISPKYNEFSQLSSPTPSAVQTVPQQRVRDITNLTDRSDVDRFSSQDCSAQLRDLSDQITQMQWSPKEVRSFQTWPAPILDNFFDDGESPPPPLSSTPSAPGILKGIHGHEKGHQEAANRMCLESEKRLVLSGGQAQQREDSGSWSPTNTSLGDGSPGRGSPIESGRLTPSKRSVSLSITNLLKRISPHFRKQPTKDPGQKSNSVQSSAQSLTNTSDADTDAEASDPKGKHSGLFSRNRMHKSFMKIVGRSNSRSKKNKMSPENSHYIIEPREPDKQGEEGSNGFIARSHEDILCSRGLMTHADHCMKDNTWTAQACLQDQNVNHGVNLEQRVPALAPTQGMVPHNGQQEITEAEPKTSQSRMDFFTEFDINAILHPHMNNTSERTNNTVEDNEKSDLPGISPSRTVPPSSLDVMPARTKRLLQTSVMSSISGDESIGDCSLDINLTASEPSLLSGMSQSAGSKQVVIPHSMVSSSEGQHSTMNDSRRASSHAEENGRHENNEPESMSSKFRSDASSPTDPSHKPSYLKLSCAISGYGKYCRYSTYQDGTKQSPCSSHSSLRSDVSLPESNTPGGRMPEEDSSSDLKNKSRPQGWSTSEHVGNSYAASPIIAVNGHVPRYPVGDSVKDGEYFLQQKQFEEDRIRGLCLKAETDLKSHDISEEASGRIRAAIGKANLLISQKFVQFRDLCYNHMQRSPENRETKYEDLHGFWDMVKIQVDNLDEMFAEIELMKLNGWQEVPRLVSRCSSGSSSTQSGSLSQGSTPAITPADTPDSGHKNLRVNGSKDLSDPSPERAQRASEAAKARDRARKKMLAEKRAAMKQAVSSPGETEVEIYLPEPTIK